MDQNKTDRRTFLATAAATGAALAAAGSVPALAEAATRTARSSAATTTLTWGWWQNSPTKDAAYRAWLQGFEATHPGIKIKAEILPWSSYWDKLHTTLAAGNAYDVIGMSTGMVPQYFQNDLFYNLTQFSDYTMAAKNLQAATKSLFYWNGKQYGLPTGIALWVMGYNKTLFKAAGVAYPDPVKPMTFAELMTIAKKLTIKKNGRTVQYALAPGAILDWNELVEMRGGQVYDHAVNPTRMTMNTPAAIQGLADYQSMFTEGVTPSIDHIADFGGGYIGSLQTGKIAIAAVGPWDFGTIVASKLNYGVAPSVTIKRAAMDSGANGYGIYKGSKNTDAAWTFIKWATQTQNQLNYAKFSDIPVDHDAFLRVGSVIQPESFVQTLRSQENAFRPGVLTPSAQLSTTLTNITNDLARGRLTPAKAAAQMQEQGNALLSQAQH